jgi:cell division cycle protein 37
VLELYEFSLYYSNYKLNLHTLQRPVSIIKCSIFHERMARRSLDYSKWDNIELSDDESDLHPNIDKDSWFRMKHRTRLEREQKEDMEMAEYDKLSQEDNIRIRILKTRITRITKGEALDEDEDLEDLEALQGELDELQGRIVVREKRKNEIKERRMWNIDNICQTKEEKSMLNANQATSLSADDFNTDSSTDPSSSSAEESSRVDSVTEVKVTNESKPGGVTTSLPLPVKKQDGQVLPMRPAAAGGGGDPVKRERFAAINYNDYAIKHEQLLERFSEIFSLEDSKEFLFKHCDVLLHEHAQSYMLLSCLEDQINGKFDRMKLVCRQSQILTHIQELGTSMNRDPRDVILPFFYRISQPEYLKGFQQAVADFTSRIVTRAVEKRKELDAEAAAADGRPKRGPGGLDPLEVMEQLPAELRAAFESQDIGRLQGVLLEMAPIDAKRWMKLCVDSGLWVPQDDSIFENESEFPPEGEEEESDEA